MRFDIFLSRIDELDVVKKYSERLSVLFRVQFEDLTQLPYQDVKHRIPELMEQGKYEEVIFKIISCYKKKITFNRVKKADNYDKLKFIFWVQDQYVKMNQIEEKYLTSPPDADLVRAGIKDLDVLGDDNLIDALAQGDIERWERIREMPYDVIFRKQLKNTIERRVFKKHAEIKSKKK